MNSSTADEANGDASNADSPTDDVDQLTDENQGTTETEPANPDGNADPVEDADPTPVDEAASGDQTEERTDSDSTDDATAPTDEASNTDGDDAAVPITLESGGPVNLDQQLDVLYGDGLVATQSWIHSLWEDATVGPLMEGVESMLMAMANRSKEIALTAAALLTGFLVMLDDEQKLAAAKVVKRLRKRG
ncbi:MAG: hypothetical protein KDA93_13075 [Planctomycetaceae bacterium]|nr:hypothetical protein [Planctomycetaceae bacterium]